MLRTWLPEHLQVSIFLYQPIDLPSHPAGRLVDVGLRPSQVSNRIVHQPVGAGLTGAFFARTSASEIFQPISQVIDEEAVRSYEAMMPLELRRSQVRLESIRYPHVKFHHDALPPVGCTIHQLALAPKALDLELLDRFPVLGLVYTMTPDKESTPTVHHLIHVSQFVSQIALAARASCLWGKSLVDAAKREVDESLFKGKDMRPRLDELVRLCVVFLLSHHWFFPHKPSAWEALKGACGGNCSYIFDRFGWPQPPAQLPSIPEKPSSWVEILVRDLVHIARQLCGPIPENRAPERLASAMSTALAILTGRKAWIREADRKKDLVTLRPRVEVPHEGVLIPVFLAQSVKNALYNRRNGGSSGWIEGFLRSIGPGAVSDTENFLSYSAQVNLDRDGEKPSRKKDRLPYLKPEKWLRYTGHSPIVVVPSDENLEHNHKWLFGLMQLVLEISPEEMET